MTVLVQYMALKKPFASYRGIHGYMGNFTKEMGGQVRLAVFI